jgi:hypothetical protein
VEVENKAVSCGPLTIQVGEESCTIDHELASIIYVKKNEGDARN